MREITVKYQGSCRACGASLSVGSRAIYERHVGLFCPPCAPKDSEAIRELRQEAADRKADKYNAWAQKREDTANATLSHIQEHYRGDIAFNTQPGHIPFRARIVAQEDRAYQSLNKAAQMRKKAESLRTVRVAGDKEKAREEKREAVRAWIHPGMRVDTSMYGSGTVAKVNRKTATIENTGSSGTYRVNVDLSWLTPEEG